MLRLVLTRAAQSIPVLVIASILIFSMVLLIPGDPTIAILGEFSSPEDRARLATRLGLDEPIFVQYARWVGNILSGDLGTSLRTKESVWAMLVHRFPVTFELTLLSIGLAVLLGVPAGILAALRRNTASDFVLNFIGMSSLAIPHFWAGILLISLFSIHLGWLPSSGYVPFWEDPIRNLQLMILPTLIVGTAMAALIMRQTRAAMLRTISMDYIRTARAKGAGPLRILFIHALRNALIPVVTVVGLELGTLIGGAVITETVFSLPGLGRMVVDGIFWRDFQVVQSSVLIIVICVLAINLLVDLSYAVIDPKVKMG